MAQIYDSRLTGQEIYDSRHTGQEVDDAVDAVQTTIPSQLNQIGSNLDEIDTQVATINSKIGNLTELETTDKSDLVSAINEIVAAMADQSVLEALTRKVNANTEKLESFIVTNEDGFYLVDDSFYIGAYINAEGSSGFGGGLTYKIV